MNGPLRFLHGNFRNSIGPSPFIPTVDDSILITIFLQFTLLEKIDTTYHKKTFYRMLPLKTITSMMYFLEL